MEGQIQGTGTQVIYQAPAQAGRDVVTVKDKAGNIGTVKIWVLPVILSENATWEVFTDRSQINVLTLSEDGQTVWVGTDGGLEQREVATGELKQVFLESNGLPDKRVTALLADGYGGVWVGTKEGTAHYLANGQWQVFNTENVSPSIYDYLDAPVKTFLSDENGGVWVGTTGGGLAHYTAEGLLEVFHRENSAMPSDRVSAILSDGQGGLWVGTEEDKSELVYDDDQNPRYDGGGNLLYQSFGGGVIHFEVNFQISGQGRIFGSDAMWVMDTSPPPPAPPPTGEGRTAVPVVFTPLPLGEGPGVRVNRSPTLHHYRIFNKENQALPSNNVSALLSDGQGGLWVGTDEYQVVKKDEDGTWKKHLEGGGLAHRTANGQWEIFNKDNSALSSNKVSALLSDGNGGLWARMDKYKEGKDYLGEGLAHYTVDGQWQIIETANNISVLLSDRSGGVWAGFPAIGLENDKYVGSNLVHYTDHGDVLEFNPNNSKLPNSQVHALLLDGRGSLWVGTQGGLARYHTTEGQWQVFNTDNSARLGQVYALLADHSGGLWVGNSGGGTALAYLTAKGQWQSFGPLYSRVPFNWANALLSDGRDGLWMGTWEGLAHYNLTSHQWQIFSQQIDYSGVNWELLPVSNINVDAMLVDGNGTLWVGTFGGGLAYYTDKGWQVFNQENSALPSNEVSALLSDKDGGLWVGTAGGGLAYHTAEGQWQEVFNQDNSGLPSNVVSTLRSDENGELWVGTAGGGLAHRLANGQWQVFNEENLSLPSNAILALLSDQAGGMWVGTSKGLVHCTTACQRQEFPPDWKLPATSVHSFLSDGYGGLWMGIGHQWVGKWMGMLAPEAGGGVAHYSPSSTGSWLLFNSENSALPSNEVSALALDAGGDLWVGTGGGLSHLTFPTQQAGHRAAIIIAGGGNHEKNSLWKATEAIATDLYKMLHGRYFVKEEIYYLSPKGWADFNGDGRDDRIVDAPLPERPLVLNDIQQAFAWAKERGKLDQPLYVFFMDHGGPEQLQLAKLTYMQATELKTILDDYQNATGNRLILVIEACYSGSFQPVLQDPRRAIITSASATEVANFVEEQGFTSFLTRLLFSNAHFFEAYQLAQREQNKLLEKLAPRTLTAGAAEIAKTTQSPQLDDNGDGVSDAKDGEWLKTEKLNGDQQKEDFTLDIENQTPPATLAAGQDLKLEARAGTVNGRVERVWAVIRPPRMNRVIDTNGTPILALPRAELSVIGDTDRWQATWNDAVYNGEYEIIFYAKDQQGNIVNSETSATITVTGGVEPPSQTTVTVQVEKDRYQRGEPFQATLTEDLGWGYDLYAVLQMPDETTLLSLKHASPPVPIDFVTKTAEPWTVQNSWERPQHRPITLLELKLPDTLPTGKYCLYGILSPEQNDVFDVLRLLKEEQKALWVIDGKCFEIQ